MSYEAFKGIVIVDAELWSDENVHARNWRGILDFPPLLMQLAAVKLRVKDNRLISVQSFNEYVRPVDEFGNEPYVSDYLTELTGITSAVIEQFGLPLREVITRLYEFCGDAHIYSYGDDMRNNILQSCYIAGIPMPFRATKCHDTRAALMHCVPMETLENTNSGNLCRTLGIPFDIKEHDALQDVMSQVYTLQHFVDNGKIKADDLLVQHNHRRTRAVRYEKLARGVYSHQGYSHARVFVDKYGSTWLVPASAEGEGWEQRDYVEVKPGSLHMMSDSLSARRILGIPDDV